MGPSCYPIYIEEHPNKNDIFIKSGPGIHETPNASGNFDSGESEGAGGNESEMTPVKPGNNDSDDDDDPIWDAEESDSIPGMKQ